MIVLWVLAPTLAWSESTCDFDYLKSELPNIYAKIVEKTDTLPKVFSFCDNEYHYLFNVSMFQKFNNGRGITRSLEKDLFSYLLEEFDANSYSRTSLMVRKDQQLELVTTVTNRWGRGSLYSHYYAYGNTTVYQRSEVSQFSLKSYSDATPSPQPVRC